MTTEISGNLEPASRSKYRRAPRPISFVGIILGMVLGIGGGLAYAWAINPVVEFNTEP
jgi:hypothetical protein